jgi:hypothetical protein
VGRNGSGKSSLLQALCIFYDTKANIAEDDFFNGNMDCPIEIVVEFHHLAEEEKAEFSRYVSDDSFAVTKRFDNVGGSIEQKYYSATKQIPQIATIRKSRTVTEKRNAWNTLVEANALPDIGPVSVRGDTPDELFNDYENAHPELAEWVPEPVQFLGPPNIGGGSLDKFTKFVYVPAVRDATDDTTEKKGSPLAHLLDFIVMRRFRARAEVIKIKNDFSERLTALYDSAKLIEFNDLAQDISGTLRMYVPNASLNLSVATPKLPDIPSPATIANLIEDGYEGAIDRKGHGLQRALIFSLLQHLAVAEPIEAETEIEDVTEASAEPVIPSATPVMPAIPALIIAIEEPELYQHPLRARHLARILKDMSRESSMGPGGQNQILYTTHSPYFVDLERFDQLRLMRKYKEGEAEPPCTGVTNYTLHEASQEMARITGTPPENFTAQSFRARAHPVMTQSVNEGFFADAVVLVEGNTEAAALLALSYRLGSDWLSKGVAVVPVEGKTKIDRAAVVFKGLQIPTYLVFDGDNRHEGRQQGNKEADSNRLLLRLCGAAEVDFPETTVTETYGCFANDFETYCKDTLGEETYEAIAQCVAESHGYSSYKQGIKNYDVVEDLISAIYEQAHKLPVVEEIICRVNNMLMSPGVCRAEQVVNQAAKAVVENIQGGYS